MNPWIAFGLGALAGIVLLAAAVFAGIFFTIWSYERGHLKAGE